MGMGMETELGDLKVMMYYIGFNMPASGLLALGHKIEEFWE
jgi:hypothetical protein